MPDPATTNITTGIEGLDRILPQGFAPGSLVVIGGSPGTGKTILAQQICFRNASEDRQALYYTTLSEPHSKLIKHLTGLSFFQPEKLGTSVVFHHLGALGGGGQDAPIEDVADVLVSTALEQRPSVIVIDSSRALREANPEGFRTALFDMASKLAHSEAVLFMVGEYGVEDVRTAPEFAVADAIIMLSSDNESVMERRFLNVLKLRGGSYLAGRHSIKIDGSGMSVFVRPESVGAIAAPARTPRLSTGIAGLDDMTQGGYPGGSVTLLAGPSGGGKTVMGLQFVAEGLKRKEPALFVSFLESGPQLIEKGGAFGFSFAEAVASGLLTILHLQPVELGLDQVADSIIRAISRTGAKRVVIDSMGELQHAAMGSKRFADYLWTLLSSVRASGATSCLTSETAGFFGATFELGRGMSFVADNVILLRYAELDSEIRRMLGVIKMRDSDHTKSLVEFTIGSKGVDVKGKFAGLAGVLSGAPVRTEEKFKEFFGKS